jgi:hypothetical protein
MDSQPARLENIGDLLDVGVTRLRIENNDHLRLYKSVMGEPIIALCQEDEEPAQL